jgi:predicted nucleic acid-binding protein
VARTVILDTGFLIALVNGGDPDHVRCREVWSDLHARILSVEGVLVEAAHMLRRVPGGAEASIGLVTSAEVTFVPLDARCLDRATVLMRRHHDVPMDFVDAALVTIGEMFSVTEVLTLDVRGFSTYRSKDTGAFTLLPAPGLAGSTSRPRKRRGA